MVAIFSMTSYVRQCLNSGMMRSPLGLFVRCRSGRRAPRRCVPCRRVIAAAISRGQRDLAPAPRMVELDSDLGVVWGAKPHALTAARAGRNKRAVRPLAVPGVVGRRVATVPHEVAAVREL